MTSGIYLSATEARAVLRALEEAGESLDALIQANTNPSWARQKYMDWPAVRNWRGCIRSFYKLRKKIKVKLHSIGGKP